MRSMDCKARWAAKHKLALSVALAGTITLASAPAKATGIPVYCYNCQEASHNAAHSIMDAIRGQTEALLNGMDYVMRTQEQLATAREAAAGVTEQKIENAQAMDVSMGAKPRVACAQFGAATTRAGMSGGVRSLAKTLASNTQRYNQRNRDLPPSEPRKDYAIKEIIDKLDPEKPEDKVMAGPLLLEDTSVDPKDATLVAKLKALLNLLLNPYPVEEPAEKQVAYIKEHGSPLEKQRLAETIVLQKRQEVGQYVFDEAFARNLKTLDTERIKYLIDDIKDFMSDEDKKAFATDKVSPNEFDDLMANYRVRSAKWYSGLMVGSKVNPAKDQTMIQAEILAQLYAMNKTNNQILRLLAAKDVRETSQSGLTSR